MDSVPTGARSRPTGEAAPPRTTPDRPAPDRPAPDRPSRRLLARSLVRSLLQVAAVLVLYYVLPLDRRRFSGETLLWLVGGLALVAALVAWQVRSILRHRYPGLRAVEALSTSIPLFLLIFAGAYEVMAAGDPAAFSQPLTRTDTLYFVVTVFATVGFGDITAVSEAARAVVTVQMLCDLVLIGLVVRAITAAVSRGREQHGAGAAVPGAPGEDDRSRPPAPPGDSAA